MSAIKRICNRLKWIFNVSLKLGDGIGSKIKIIFGGLWLLITDAGKSKLRFNAGIRYFGKTQTFRFEDVSDFGLMNEVFLADNYPVINQKIQTIFDIGANVGVSTLCFKMRYPEAKIYSFEPDPENFRRLKYHTEKFDDVEIFETAVWSEDTILTFYSDPHRGSSSSALKIRDRQKPIQVQASTLKTIIDETGVSSIDILKIDIEGAEEAVFSAWTDSLPVTCILGEIHGDLCNGDSVITKIQNLYHNVELKPFNEGKRFYVVATHPQ